MAAGQIRITPEQLRGEAKNLRQLGEEHDQIFKRIQNLVVNLRQQWEGQALEAFERAFESAKAELAKFKLSVDNFGQNMDVAANTLEQTDRDLGSKLG